MGFDSRATIRRLVHAATVLAAAALVAGCFQPLYGDRTVSGGPELREALSGIQVMEIRAAANTPEARMAVPIQNDLRFNFTGGGERRAAHPPAAGANRRKPGGRVRDQRHRIAVHREFHAQRDLQPGRDRDEQAGG